MTCFWSCAPAGDAELEVWAAQRHVEPFEELMEKPVRLALQPQRNEMASGAKPPRTGGKLKRFSIVRVRL